MSIIDWLWWTAGGAVGLGGLVILFRALCSDRSRGRRRCPKCWYLMEGLTGTRCPECGREQKRLKRLFRTRRHWRMAVVGAALLLAGGACLFGQRVHRHGWVRATPSIIYIAALPRLDANAGFTELSTRAKEGRLRRWEYRLLVRRVVDLLEKQDKSPQVLAEYIGLLASLESGGGLDAQFLYGDTSSAFDASDRWQLVSNVDCDRAVDMLVTLMSHDDPTVSLTARGALLDFRERAGRAFPAIIAQMPETRFGVYDNFSSFEFIMPPERKSFDPALRVLFADIRNADTMALIQDLVECEQDTNCALGQLRLGLDHQAPIVRTLSMLGLFVMGEPLESSASRILALCDEPIPHVRQTAISTIARLPFGAQHESILRAAITDPLQETRLAAFETIEHFGDDARSLRSDLREFPPASRRYAFGLDRHEHVAATRAFIAVGGDPVVALEPFVHLPADQDDVHRIRSGLYAIIEVDAKAPPHTEALLPLLDHEDPHVRLAASRAFATLGGSPTRASKVIVDVIQKASPLEISRYRADLLEFASRGHCDSRVLSDLLYDDSPTAIVYGADCMELVGTPAIHALPRLRELSNDELSRIANAAQRAVIQLNFARRMN